MRRTVSVIVYTVIIVLVTALLSSGATMLFVAARDLDRSESLSISAEEYERLQAYDRLDVLADSIDYYYYQDVDPESVMDGAAYGMVDSLGDPYSTYLTAEDMDALLEEDSGVYVGIGGTFLMDPEDGSMVITRIYPDSPLSETDAQVGDALYAVNGEVILGLDQNSIAAMIRGEEGTQVSITLLRDGEQREYTLDRRKVEVVDVDHRMLEDDVLLVTLSSFSTNADAGFIDALNFGKQEGMKGLILDLRGNGGGDSTILDAIADQLLPEGVIYYSEDKQGNRETSRSDANYLGLPVVVLCDENSASASEVLIAALQDYGAATIVGTRTFGKAIGQSTIQLFDDGAGIYLTTVRVFSPNGRNWHGEGLEPDITVELPEELAASPLDRTDENDLQLQEALRVIHEQIAEKDAA